MHYDVMQNAVDSYSVGTPETESLTLALPWFLVSLPLVLQQALTQRIVDARKKLKSVQIPYEFRVKISAICSELNVDGIRGDIVSNRAAKALASLEGRDEVAVEDIYRCAQLVGM